MTATVLPVVLPRAERPAAPGWRAPVEDLSPDAALVDRFRAGERDAVLTALFEQHRHRVFRFVLKRVGNRELAEDLTQDVFLRAWRRGLDSFEVRDTPIGGWLHTIARNLVADYFKSKRYQLEVLSPAPGDAVTPDPGRGPEELAVDGRLRAVLVAHLSELTAEQAEVLQLRFLEGLTVVETARRMRKNEGAIKAAQYRAVRAIARLMDPEAWR